MPFNSPVVKFQWYNNSVILTRGQTTLQILPEDTTALRTMQNFQEFEQYLNTKALKNRDARRTYESWLRRDPTLTQQLFAEMTSSN